MEVQTTFDVLSRILDEHDSHDRTVTNVEATNEGADDGTLHVSMDVPVDLRTAGKGTHSGLAAEDATFTERGTLQVEFAASELVHIPPSLPATVSLTDQEAVVSNGELLVTVDLTIEPPGDGPLEPETGGTDTGNAVETGRPETGADADGPEASGSGDGPEAVRDESVPPYEDTEYLRALYDAHDTFSEMGEEILMDVSGETVRRYMIEAGVHDPVTYETATGAMQNGTRSEQSVSLPDEHLIADGTGLPEDVGITDVVEAVVGSATVYEVERELDLEGERVRGLLRRLDLLDLVLRRIDDGDRRGVTYEEASRRVRRCTDAGGEHPAP
jgi:hypothetical protein